MPIPELPELPSGLPPHPVHEEAGVPEFDLFIAGSGPIGALFARTMVDKGFNVVMVEIGDQQTRIPAEHKKNEITFQKDIDRFVRVIQGDLATCSIPPSSTITPTLDPSAWSVKDPAKSLITHGRNPYQQAHNNLGAEAVTRCVGGMASHWTCATPEFLKGIERPKIFPDNIAQDDLEWATLYAAAKTLIGTSDQEFTQSIRHNVVLETLRNNIHKFSAEGSREVKALPLACHRPEPANFPWVFWHSAEQIYGDMFTNPEKKNDNGKQRGVFRLLTNTRCTRLIADGNPGDVKIRMAEVKDLLRITYPESEETASFEILAKVFVVAAGAVATPQILANSGFGGFRDQAADPLIPNLGKYITEQPMSFCQIILKQELVDNIANTAGRPSWWQQAVSEHKRNHPEDPCPIPFLDPEPQVTIPFTAKYPWHTQIHRDAFSYGEAGPGQDPRVVVDLRFFAMQDGVAENKMVFERDVQDAYGMPQMTFEYLPTPARALECGRMMNDMTNVASILGGYKPGSEPQFMTPGLALHLGGTVRLGHSEAESCADYNSKVWKTQNLFVGGNGIIPTPFGANPTLTSLCLAIRATREVELILMAVKRKGPAITASSKEDLRWLFDDTSINYPNHRGLRKLHTMV